MIYVAFEKCGRHRLSQHESGIAARDKLFSLFGIEEEVQISESGKPYVEKDGVSFSVSHTDGLAACALRVKDENYDLPDEIFTVFENGEGEVGIDIEVIPPDADLQKYNRIAARFFGTEFASAEEFLARWTKTEAAAKADGKPLATVFKAGPQKEFFTGRLELDGKNYIFTIAY